MNFNSWQDYRDKCVELDLYTKTHLNRMRLKPKKDAISEMHLVYTDDTWKEFKFYKLEDAEEIKIKAKPVIRELESTPENLCQSLYIINKSAKRSRDTKGRQYEQGHHGMVSKAKERQNNLYVLKDAAIDNMLRDSILKIKGYNIQMLDFERMYLILYSYKDYSFHKIVEKYQTKGMKYLGEIDSKISAECKIKGIKFNEAVNLIKRYIGEKEEKAAVNS